MRSKMAVSVAALAAGLALASSASAAVNLVANGGFETNGGNGQVNFSTTLDSWNVQALNTSYVFVFNPQAGTTSGTSADNAGAPGEYDHAPNPNLKLWGPGTGSNNGLSDSPDDGAFIAADPDYQNSAITQTLNGLVAGDNYKVEFYFAGSQQFGYDGPTTEGWQVRLGGGAAQNTLTLNNASHGFTGWNKATMFFTADGATQTLSFLATGGPASSLPPFALLDGVSVSVAPEPTTWALMIIGFGGIGAMTRNRRRQAAVA
jgi:hypothetical protein